MLAVIELGNKQYIVEKDTVIDVEKLDGAEEKKRIPVDNVLLLSDGNTTEIGQPYLSSASVEAEVVEQFRDKKITVFKFKRKTGYKLTKGHRQHLTRLKIVKIAAGKSAPKKTTSEEKTSKAASSDTKKETTKKSAPKKAAAKPTAKKESPKKTTAKSAEKKPKAAPKKKES